MSPRVATACYVDLAVPINGGSGPKRGSRTFTLTFTWIQIQSNSVKMPKKHLPNDREMPKKNI